MRKILLKLLLNAKYSNVAFDDEDFDGQEASAMKALHEDGYVVETQVEEDGSYVYSIWSLTGVGERAALSL